jgi:hypothetical protein
MGCDEEQIKNKIDELNKGLNGKVELRKQDGIYQVLLNNKLVFYVNNLDECGSVLDTIILLKNIGGVKNGTN